ncbi:MAG: cyclic nucleotide-binding domain-containing protein, partial [Sedimentisphaerales bacterium]|nr:cyclic nucleotide-binding domain-containing protein [Sedimentisphaerales bacterium]
LLTRAEQIAREDLGALYIEADVNAYIPAIQRTLERMGFMAVAYCPSMVFENVERLDVVRMAKLIAPYFQEDIPLTGSAGKIRDIVEVSMADRRESNVVVQTARNTELFRGLGDGDIYHLARLGRLKQIPKGKHVIRHGESGDRMYIVVSGTMQVVIDDGIIGQIGPGETVGEMALLDTLPRSADVISMSDATVIEILRTDFLRLMETHPRLGAVVMGNLAKNLAEKMRNLDQRYINKRYTT